MAEDLNTNIDESEYMKNQIELINRVPSGMGIYTIQNGIIRQAFLNDGYFKMLGLSRNDREKFLGEETIKAVHPDDRVVIYDGVKEAIAGSGVASRTIRMVLHDDDTVLWVQMDGRVVSHHDDNYTIYVSFTNVDELMRTSNELQKNQKTLEASLSAGHQMCCEYDPVKHTLTGKTGQSGLFDLPNCVENFPDSLFVTGIFHPDDETMIRKKMKELDEGAKYTEIEARIRFKENLRWFRFCFQKLYDEEKGYEVAICNFMNITVQREALEAYKNHLDTVMKLNPDSIATFRMNLTKDSCTMGSSIYHNILKLQDEGTITSFFGEAEKLIRNQKNRQIFHETFQLKAMIDSFNQGNRHLSLNHPYELENGHMEWIRTSIDLMENPETNDIEGILYTENINREKVEEMILAETMRKDYLQIVVQYENQMDDEYYLFDNVTEEYCVLHKGLWSVAFYKEIESIVDNGTKDYFQIFSKENVHKQLKNQNEYTITYERIDKPGHRFQVQYSYVNREEQILMITCRDITDVALIEKLRHDSEHDALTGLYNREKLYNECDKMLAAHPNEAFALVQLDVQRFRLYNSYYGEKEGDKLLCYIADMLRDLSKTHAYGVYGRSHSDVFFFCFPMSSGVIGWNQDYIHDYLKKFKKDFYVIASCGIYISKGPHQSSRIMFEKAVVANKNNPNKSFNRVNFYDDHMEHEMNREQRIEKEMKDSLQNQEFTIFIQPKYSVKEGKIYGGEALVRWQHPERGLIPPDQFIPIFERNGFIMELDRYVWEQVCILLHKWREEGKNPGPISVNMSRVSMYSNNTVPFLVDLVRKYDVPVDLLNLELTESAFMEEPENMKRRLMQLHNEGFQIMMDDFGSAYSSLNMLREISFDYLKLDRKFLASVDQDERGQIVISSIVHMAKELHMPVVVEGVETEKQKDFVSKIGCDYIQGFYYARPMPYEEYEKRI